MQLCLVRAGTCCLRKASTCTRQPAALSRSEPPCICSTIGLDLDLLHGACKRAAQTDTKYTVFNRQHLHTAWETTCQSGVPRCQCMQGSLRQDTYPSVVCGGPVTRSPYANTISRGAAGVAWHSACANASLIQKASAGQPLNSTAWRNRSSTTSSCMINSVAQELSCQNRTAP